MSQADHPLRSEDAQGPLYQQFQRLIELKPAARAHSLELLERTNPTEAAHLAALLESHEAVHTFLDSDIDSVLHSMLEDDIGVREVELPERIGEYRVLHELGRGGTSIVVLGERDRPFRRVAIKCLLQPRVSPQSRARFDTEQELLSRLHHPGIVSLFDCGTMQVAGSKGVEPRPWFAMELVEGDRLDAWLAAATRSYAQRLQVFEEILAAVAHAHARGVVHADLKPANILIDATGRIRVLDFGAAHPSRNAPEDEALWATPRYASPEVLRGETHELNLQSDVYSLGLLGLELFAVSSPSATNADRLVSFLQRGTETPPSQNTCSPDLSREMNAILRCATMHDPRARYTDAVEFADDLARARAHRPIRALPSTLAYSVSCALRRSPLAYSAGGSLLLTLALAIAFVSASRAQVRDAEFNATIESRAATREAELSEQMLAFLVEVLGSNHPARLGSDITIRDAITEAAARIDTELHNDPYTAASLHLSIAETFMALAESNDARTHFDRALQFSSNEDSQAHHSRDKLRAISRRASVGVAQLQLMAGEVSEFDRTIAPLLDTRDESTTVDEALVCALQLAAQRQLQTEGPEVSIATLRLALAHARSLGRSRLEEDVRNGLGAALTLAGQFEAAASELEPIVESRRARFGDSHPDLAAAMYNLAVLRQSQGHFEPAIALFREVLAVYVMAFGNAHPRIAEVQYTLGSALRDANQPEEALEQYALASDLKHRTDPLRRAAFQDELHTLQTAHAHAAAQLNGGELAQRTIQDGSAARSDPSLTRGTRSALSTVIVKDPGLPLHLKHRFLPRGRPKSVNAMLLLPPLSTFLGKERGAGEGTTPELPEKPAAPTE